MLWPPSERVCSRQSRAKCCVQSHNSFPAFFPAPPPSAADWQSSPDVFRDALLSLSLILPYITTSLRAIYLLSCRGTLLVCKECTVREWNTRKAPVSRSWFAVKKVFRSWSCAKPYLLSRGGRCLLGFCWSTCGAHNFTYQKQELAN